MASTARIDEAPLWRDDEQRSISRLKVCFWDVAFLFLQPTWSVRAGVLSPWEPVIDKDRREGSSSTASPPVSLNLHPSSRDGR